MNKEEALKKMIPPGAHKAGKWREGVIQIWTTRTCDKSCFGCTQGSNLKSSSKENMHITLLNFEIAVKSLVGYHGVVGVFGGNPALHPQFAELCEILEAYIPWEQRGLWCNKPFDHAPLMRKIFNPAYSNLNVHLDKEAYEAFKRGWPECKPVGLETDSRHAPVHAAMKDLQYLPDPENHKHPIPNTEETRWDYIAKCDINHHWSGMIGQFRGQPRAWFCEVAGAQSMLMQDQPCPACDGQAFECVVCNQTGSYPDTGVPLPTPEVDGPLHSSTDEGKDRLPPIGSPWWRRSMQEFENQVVQHCHSCMVPIKGYGELACSTTGIEQTTRAYLPIFIPKKTTRAVSLAETHSDLLPGKLSLMTNYIGNAKK